MIIEFDTLINRQEVIDQYTGTDWILVAESNIVTGNFLTFLQVMSLNINKVIVKDSQGNILKVKKNNKDYLNGNLVSIQKGKVLCKDDKSNFYWVNCEDKRYQNGTLKPINKGLILVKDTNDKIMMIDKDDEKFKNGEVKPFWFNRKHTNESKKKIGEKNSIKQKGEKNSQFGTCWIVNEEEKKCIKIKKEELENYLSIGWKKGRKMNW